uniref:G-protein coupled receptors family 1 profile domain-containing protein n=1 Tax=Monopterus albus TaxID=43700 RepID=A0A3Q3R2L3_MONAL
MSANRTVINIDICFETSVSYVLTSTHSILCTLLNIFLSSLSCITVCGNLLVIIAIIYFKQLHTPTNDLILSLAVADLLVGFAVSPLAIKFSMSSCLYQYNVFCKVRSSFAVSLCTSSILNLCCISVDRYYAVCKPLTYRTKINVRVIVIMILVSWGVAVVIGIILLIAGLNQKTCTNTCLHFVIVANIMALLLAFYLPMIVMLLCMYMKIFLVAQRQARSIQNTKSGATVSKMERKATKTLAIVMGVFLICWSPYFLSVTVIAFSKVTVPLVLLELLAWFALSNSTLNPFIYAFFYSWFRSAFRIIISGKIIQGDVSSGKDLIGPFEKIYF